VGRDFALMIGGAAVVAACAQVTIPWYPVPFTLQTMAVFLCGLALGSKRGVGAIVIYLAAALCHLPVLAGGLAFSFGPTVGYLIGFLPAAYLLGVLAERGWDRHLLSIAGAMLIAGTIVLASGAIWLSAFVGPVNAFRMGVAPFLIGELVKIGVVTLVLPGAWKLVGKNQA